jgi:hypothetical protein
VCDGTFPELLLALEEEDSIIFEVFEEVFSIFKISTSI